MRNPAKRHATRTPLGTAEWRAAGLALADAVDISVLVLAAADLAALAAVALGVAEAAGPGRRVAVFDLAGAFGSDDEDGVSLAFRDGRSLNALARPLEATSMEHFLVPRGPMVVEADFARHERWPRLIEGFRATGSLLVLLVADADRATGARARRQRGDTLLDGLAAFADQVLVASERRGTPRLDPLASLPDLHTAPAIAPSESGATPSRATPIASLPIVTGETAIEAERVLPRTTPTTPGYTQTDRGRSQVRAGRTPVRPMRRWERRAALVLLVAGAIVGEWIWSRGKPAADDDAVALPAALAANVAPLAGSATAAAGVAAAPNVVNPEDAERAAEWSVELVITNDRSEARYWIEQYATLPAATVSPLWVELEPLPWHSIIVGAATTRTEALQLRTALRRTGVIDLDEGVIARVPFAVRIHDGLTPEVARTRVRELAADSIAAYALRADDGTASVYTGAFALPEQSIHLLVELRRRNLDPVFAYRVGRTY